MRASSLPAWKHRPALRLLVPVAAGILLQWYAAPPPWLYVSIIAAAALAYAVYSMLPVKHRFQSAALNGAALHLLLLGLGAAWCSARDIRHNIQWPGAGRLAGAVVLRLDETPQEKAAGWKATATMLRKADQRGWTPLQGKAQLFFRKADALQLPGLGQEILLNAPLEPISSSGNPGGFDYRQWCLFQGITHSAYIQPQDFRMLAGDGPGFLENGLEKSRAAVTGWLRRYLQPEESGLAEALLIGYKNDLDKELVQSYARTGVVHIIAISGMHLALVYALLLGLTMPLRAQRFRLLRLVLVLGGLWGFSLLCGGGPSVLRSAVMFSFLAVGGLLGRKGDSINTLLLAALVLLLINPFWLWDAGFRLSFAAVGGILLFYRPLYQLYRPDNRLLDAVWQGAALSLAAQVLTAPLSLYYFHQFPILFLLANLVAVPLSGILVYALLALCALSFWPAAAKLAATVCGAMIRLLNWWVQSVDANPAAAWNGLQITPLQAMLLFGAIGAAGWALLRQRRAGWYWAAVSVVAVLSLRTASFYQAGQQQRLVVFQVPHASAMEVFDGRSCAYRGDPAPLQQESLRSYYLDPAHTVYRCGRPEGGLPPLFRIGGKTVACIDESRTLAPGLSADLLIVSHGAKPRPGLLQSAGMIVLDGSVSRRTARRWQEACAALGKSCHSVAEDGAFVQELN